MSAFLSFKLGTTNLQFKSSFRYLGHTGTVSDSVCDKDDIRRKITNLFIRTHILIPKLKK